MSTTRASTRLALARSAQAASRARAILRRLLDDAGIGQETSETAVLLATELVSNAVEHGREPVYLDAVVRPDGVRLAVSDCNPMLPAARIGDDALDELAERGRGLMLVDALATRWGAERNDDGKTVWCEIAVA